MTGTEIHAAAERYVDEPIDTADALEAINEAIQRLGDMALVYDSTTIEAQQGTWYDLPTTLIFVEAVEDEKGFPYGAYRVMGSRIRFRDAGRYTVYFRRMANRMTALSETPEIHPAFHSAIVTYLKAWHKLKDDDENTDGIKLMVQFEQEALRAFNMVKRRKRTNATMRVVRR